MATRVILLIILTTSTHLAFVKTTAETGPSNRHPRSDDTTIESLQSVVDQQASVIQGLQSQLDAEKTRASNMEESVDTLRQAVSDLKAGNEDVRGELTALTQRLSASTTQVGFSARFGHDGGQYTGVPLGLHSTLIFDTVLGNVGQGYDPNTGIFTAPVPGLYGFFLTQMMADNGHHLWLSIVKNGQSLDRIYTEGGGSGDNHDQGASLVVTHLNKGEKVWVRQEDGGAVRGSWFTVFTGYLVQSD